MKKSCLWPFIVLALILVGFFTLYLMKQGSLPWSPGDKTVDYFVPPPAEVQSTATLFSTPEVIPTSEVQSTATVFTPSEITPTLEQDLVWIDPELPKFLLDQLALMNTLQRTDSKDEAGTILAIGDDHLVAHWIYALAAPFPTVKDGISLSELRASWAGGRNSISGNQPLLMDQETLVSLTSYWGEPADGAVEILAPELLAERAWSRRPSLAILPFELLTPDWKVIQVDGISPIQKDFDPGTYALSMPVSASGTNPDLFRDISGNRDPEKFTSVVLTGVTALVRATAWTMEIAGINYPAWNILPYLLEADILHISNEVPFYENCPYPNAAQTDLKFCSDIRYIQLMETIGTDVVELTGDHFGDYGPGAMLYTLEMYQQRDWPYYGGGANSQEAQEPVLFDHNGNKIAFLGCNAKGGIYATAGPGHPGAVACDFSKMTEQIKELRAMGYNPIATFQHFEYYTYNAQPDQIRDARTLTNAGAVIVSGSQAHHPQGFEINSDVFVHHGLGNLFFDQVNTKPPHTASAFIDRHIFYNGKHISTELLTIKFLDYARSRPMTLSEREQLLRRTFSASGW